MKNLLFLLLVSIFSMGIEMGCQNPTSNNPENSLSSKKDSVPTDSSLVQKKEAETLYEETKIGNHIWMTKNLEVNKFANGDDIPQAKNPDEWITAGQNKKPVWCYYEFSDALGARYGKIYNWYAVKDPRGLAPKGWGIPTIKDWESTFAALNDNGQSIAGGYPGVGRKLKSIDFWKNTNGNNLSGFNAFPGGGYEAYKSNSIPYMGLPSQLETTNFFYHLETDAHYWSQTILPSEGNEPEKGATITIDEYDAYLSGEYLQRNPGRYVRCIKK